MTHTNFMNKSQYKRHRAKIIKGRKRLSKRNESQYNIHRAEMAKMTNYLYSSLMSARIIISMLFIILIPLIITGHFNNTNDSWQLLIVYSKYLIFIAIMSYFFSACSIHYSEKIRITTELFNSIMTKRQIDTINKPYFRVRYNAWFVITFLFAILGILSAFSTMSSAIKYQITTAEKNSLYALTLAYCWIDIILAFIADGIAIYYLINWHKTYRWEFEELNLSNEEKKQIINTEKRELAQQKAKQKQMRKEKRTENIQHIKDKSAENIQLIQNKIQEEIAKREQREHQKYANSGYQIPAQTTKLDKLKELDELLKNNIITQEEYAVARKDILGQ